MRTGYRGYREASQKLAGDNPRDLSTSLGGILECGWHSGVVVSEVITGGNHVDVVFLHPGSGGHIRQRYWGRHGVKYRLGHTYDIEINYPRGGVRIDNVGQLFHVVDTTSGRTLAAVASIREAFNYIDEHKLRRRYREVVNVRDLQSNR